jgi:hypothetical protein
VRSAYRDIINNEATLLHHRLPGDWNSIWKLKLPPKIKNFLWRVCRACLPTRVILHSRGVACPTSFVFCNEFDEDGKHLFFECSKSMGYWQRAGMWKVIQQLWSPAISCVELIFGLLQKLDKTQKQQFGVILWSIWKGGNNKVLE